MNQSKAKRASAKATAAKEKNSVQDKASSASVAESSVVVEFEGKAAGGKKTSVGSVLKSVRLEKGLLIEEVFEQIKISTSFLEALEEDRYKDLPGEVYIIGFVRSYAQFLNIDSAPLVAQVRAHFGEGKRELQPLPAPYRSDTILPSSSILWILVIIAFAAVAWWAYFVALKPLALTQEEQGVELQDKGGEVSPLNDIEPSAGKIDLSKESLRKAENSSGQSEESVVSSLSAIGDVPADLLVAAEETVQKLNQEISTASTAKVEENGSTSNVSASDAVYGPKGQRVMFKARGEVWFQIRTLNTAHVLTNKTLQAGETFWVDQTKDVVADIGKPEFLDIYVDGKLQGTSSLRGGIIKGLGLEPQFLIKEYFGNNVHLPDNYKNNG